ncbi:magnesium protoporphyrin IX methyltransferase [Variovorax sp. KK3]|uniref:magnesium protoporphyrin IX methyltransferase n=1 Tax=Variovorax sp. KK3 TaxID=1855728 RepID=UPI00097C910F|nr:magnesium protoporphyrin IX methyltransferase [Variovorax sp. KK3]
MAHVSYLQRRGEIETYFDRTAAQAWARLTSDAPVGRIRASVRAGRERMRDTLLGWLPADLRGMRLLDAGCGTGALAVAAARRGADVVAIDLSPTLVGLARERQPAALVDGAGLGVGVGERAGRIDFRAGDMLDPGLGRFDYIVGMDSLIHYRTPDAVQVLAGLAQRADRAVLFTFAPSNPALVVFRAVGRLFPRGNRAPWIEPVAEPALHRLLDADPLLAGWRRGRTQRIASGFYTSQALEMVRS